jgi:hypothetical protein
VYQWRRALRGSQTNPKGAAAAHAHRARAGRDIVALVLVLSLTDTVTSWFARPICAPLVGRKKKELKFRGYIIHSLVVAVEEALGAVVDGGQARGAGGRGVTTRVNRTG